MSGIFQQTFVALTLIVAVAIQVCGQASSQPNSTRPNSPSAPPSRDRLTEPSVGSADLLEQLLGQESDSSNSAPQRRPDTAGEDLHADSAEHPIAIVGQQMARVQKFLRRRETSAPTQQLQARIVRDLDALIAAAEQQAGRASSQPSQNRSDANRANSNGATRPAGTPSGASPREVTVRPSGQDAVWINRIWGHLPDLLRREIQTPVHETFLPPYKGVITEYYKRLSEVDR